MSKCNTIDALAAEAAGIEPDAKKGVCAFYSKASAEKAKKGIK